MTTSAPVAEVSDSGGGIVAAVRKDVTFGALTRDDSYGAAAS